MFVTIKEQKLMAEITEKKSKFIGTLFYVQSEEEAVDIIKNTKKLYYDARHNCFAYRVMTETGIIERFSDDGEPSGTAGGPMLNILSKGNLCNVLIIVTRYFGGILLGTGGLVRAYSDATTKVISNATFASEALGLEVQVTIKYENFEMLKYYCKVNNINISDVKYEKYVQCYLEMTKEELEEFKDKHKNNENVIDICTIKSKNIRKSI